MARFMILATITLIDLGVPGTSTVIWALVRIGDRPLSLHARLLAALREYDRAKQEEEALRFVTTKTIKRHILAPQRFHILACLSSIRRWRRIAEAPDEALESFCEQSLREDFEVLHELMEQRRAILSMEETSLLPAYGDWLEERRIAAEKRFDRLYALWAHNCEETQSDDEEAGFERYQEVYL